MKINNLQNENRKFSAQKGSFYVLEHMTDRSVNGYTAQTEWFMSQMNVHKRQVMAQIKPDLPICIQKGAMQWFGGQLEAATDVKGAGDLLGKLVKGKVTGESAIKPVYKGSGILMLEPTYKHIILIDVAEWGSGITIEDGMFLACETTVEQKVVPRSNLSSAVLGNEGLFNLSLQGSGIAALESFVPESELIEVELKGDEIKIDGNMAVCWSSSLQFTVERTTKTFVGSAASGEGLVNVYRGTGKILMSPVSWTTASSTHTVEASQPKLGGFAGAVFNAALSS